jgi:hypothetical protein
VEAESWRPRVLVAGFRAWRERRAPTAAALAYPAGVPARTAWAGSLIERDQEGRVIVAVPVETYRTGARGLVTKLKTFRCDGSRSAMQSRNGANSGGCCGCSSTQPLVASASSRSINGSVLFKTYS